MKRTLCIAFAMVCACFGFSGQAFAGLSVAPGIIEMIAARQDEATGAVKVTNVGKEVVHVTVEPEDWRRGVDGRRGGPVSEWLSVEPQILDLEPGQAGEVSYHVKVPPDAAGEYAAQIFFSEAATGGGATEIRTRIGVILYVAVRETIRLESEISDVKISLGRDGDSWVLTAQVAVTNPGNVHIRPTGEVKLYDMQGNFVLAAILNTGWGILPSESYTYQGSGRGPVFKQGKYKAVATIDYGKLFKQQKSYTKDFFFQVEQDGKIRLEDKQ